MANADWRGPFFAGAETPLRFRHRPSNLYPDGDGGSAYCQRFEAYEWAAISWWGYTYVGPDSVNFPLGDGSISACLRTGDSPWGSTAAHPFGLVLRQQDLLSLDPASPSPSSSVSMYMAGVWNQSTEVYGNPRCGVVRVVNGGWDVLGDYFYPPILTGGGSRYVQIEIQLETAGTTVVIKRRYNEGTEASTPGAAGWTSLTAHHIDTSPGVLLNPGQWGFGHGCLGGTGLSGGSNNYNYIDRLQIMKGTP